MKKSKCPWCQGYGFTGAAEDTLWIFKECLRKNIDPSMRIDEWILDGIHACPECKGTGKKKK